MLKRSRKVVCSPYVQEIVSGALGGYDTCSRGVSQCFGPRGDISIVAVRVDLELLPEVRIQRRNAVLACIC